MINLYLYSVLLLGSCFTKIANCFQPFLFYPVNPMTATHCPNVDQYEYFLGKCFCAPGWELDSNSGNCSVPLLKNGNCECPPDVPDRSRYISSQLSSIIS